MSTTRYLTLIGLAIGAVWAFVGVEGAGITAAGAGVGLFVAMLVEGRIDLQEVLGDRE